MRKTKHRVIIDTNLWISFLLTKDFSKLDKIFAEDRLVLLFSQELPDEFLEVGTRPKFKKYFSVSDLEDVLIHIRMRAEFIQVKSEVKLCRDPKDNFLLSLSTGGNATYLLTGDKDLLDLKMFKKTTILTVTEYLKGRTG